MIRQPVLIYNGMDDLDDFKDAPNIWCMVCRASGVTLFPMRAAFQPGKIRR